MIAFEFGQLIIRTALQELGLYYDEKMCIVKKMVWNTSSTMLVHRCICPKVMNNRFSSVFPKKHSLVWPLSLLCGLAGYSKSQASKWWLNCICHDDATAVVELIKP